MDPSTQMLGANHIRNQQHMGRNSHSQQATRRHRWKSILLVCGYGVLVVSGSVHITWLGITGLGNLLRWPRSIYRDQDKKYRSLTCICCSFLHFLTPYIFLGLIAPPPPHPHCHVMKRRPCPCAWEMGLHDHTLRKPSIYREDRLFLSHS